MIFDWKILHKHQLRKALKKQLASLKNFLHTDDDMLEDSARREIAGVISDGEKLLTAPAADDCKAWKASAAAVMKKYNPHSSMREILDILAVALMVAFGIRALFFQPFKIPTSSMQPTLYGIHFVDTEKAHKIDGVNKLFGKLGTAGNYALFASRKALLELKNPIQMGNELYPAKEFIFFDSTILPFADGSSAMLPGVPSKVADYAELYPGKQLAGKAVDGYLSDGDHLFVNRLSLHFREPQRGDVMVFATENIIGPGGEKPSDSGDYYIKRLVGLPLDTLKIENDVLYVKPAGAEKFVPVYELAPNIKKLYSGKGGYQGHSNSIPGYSNFLRHSGEEYTVPADHYFMLGDNTRFSADSRVWGPVPRRNLIGRPAIIFWPFSRRWGTVDRLEPLDVPTGQPGVRTFSSMNLQ
ncbi:MAG: signal peptidase I [Lentisphaeria bacterium]|nr:signal peptidase I [Lentisphaeria bacterium]